MKGRVTKKERILALAHEGKSYEEIAVAVGCDIRYAYQTVSDVRANARRAKEAGGLPSDRRRRKKPVKEVETLTLEDAPPDIRALFGEEVDKSLEDAESDCGQ